MNNRVAGGQENNNPRRSKRLVKDVVSTVVESDSSDTEVEPGFVRESSSQAQYGSDSSQDGSVKGDGRMSKRDTESKDSGLGQGGENTVAEVMRVFMDEQERREKGTGGV